LTSVLRGTLALTAIAVGAARAQDSCAGESTPATASETWSTPLNKTVAVRLRDVSLRGALDRLATAARIRISYSAELLPANQRLCIPGDSISVGDALQALLRGTSLEPVIVASDLVVIAPVRNAPDGTRAAAVSQSVGVLDRVVVTGNVIASTQRPLTVGLDVIDATALERSGATTMAQTLDAFVPGLWLWEQSPTSLLANYGSIRGASSFGVSYPKIYIDGIEVANPLLVSQFSPDLIERIEVIRGPQGAALYGSDAISGVINIITSHASADASGRRTSFQSGVGL
jgi:outer membrane receptor protein involved in Fe transport